MRIGFLGLGRMGTPIALRLLAAGHELSVWNRTEEHTKPAIHEGAIAAATPAEAELGADVVMTCLLDDAAYEDVFFGIYRLIDVLSPGLLHIACATLSIAFVARLTREHAQRGIDFVTARALGLPSDAEDGRLRMISAGTHSAIDRARPLLEALSREITIAGSEPWQVYEAQGAVSRPR